MRTIILTLLLLLKSSLGAVLGIDYGHEFIKAAIVAPGRNFRIVIDETSKRKIKNLVAFDDDVRVYGNVATSMLTKKPKRAFQHISRLLGKGKDSQEAELFSSLHSLPYEFEEHERRRTLRLKTDTVPGEFLEVEELVGMMLDYVRKQATNENNGQNVKDAVITVPASWSQKERSAFLNAAELAGMNVLALVNENTAAALEYAIELDYDVEKVENFVLFNMGTTSTKASVVRYSAYKGKRDKTIGQMEVLAHSWDETFGGASFDRVIVDLVVEKLKSDPEFLKLGLEDPTTDHRVMARIWKAAGKAKSVLNTIKEYAIYIEGVYKTYDLRNFMVTREQFYQGAKTVFDKVLSPIEEAVETSGLEKENLDGIILMGGASRLVGVQDILETYLEDKELKKRLNTEEAGAFGALFMAANISTSYKVRPIGMVDILPFPVGVRVTDLEGGDYSKRGSIFKRNNKLQSIKSMRFGYDKDVRVKAQYDQAELLPQGVSPDLGTWAIKGVPAVVEQMREAGIEGKPKIYVTFKLDKNSMVRVEKARAEYLETYEVEVPKKKNATETAEKSEEGEGDAEKKSDESEDKESEGEAKSEEGEDKEESGGEKKDEEPKPEPIEMVKETKTRTKKVSLTVEYEGCDVSPFNEEEMTAAKKKLLDLDDADRSVLETAEAKNFLESYIYGTRGKFEDLEEELAAVSTEEQREAALKPLSESEDWMWEVETEDESAGLFKNRLRQTRKLADEILTRLEEFEKRPETINEAQNLIEAGKGAIQQLEEEMTWVPETDRTKLKDLIEDYETWLNEKIEAQAKLEDTENPAFKCKAILKRAEEFTKLKNRLLKWPKPKEKKKKKKKKGKDEEGEEAKSGDEEDGSTAEAADAEKSEEEAADKDAGDDEDKSETGEEEEETEGNDGEEDDATKSEL